MYYQFILQNFHFVLSVYAGFVFFAIFWLHFDAWSQGKLKKDLFKFLGFLLIAVSFLINSTFVEFLSDPSAQAYNLGYLLFATTRVAGYLFLIFGLFIDPIPKLPETHKLTKENFDDKGAIALPSALSAAFSPALLQLLFAPLSLVVLLRYYRRATTGLEKHLKPFVYAFFIFTLSELLSISALFRTTDNPTLYNLVAPFGPVWLAGNILLLAAVILLHRWVFGYLLKRFVTQIFMVLVSAVLIIFVFITGVFTTILLGNFQNESLQRVETDVRLLNYAIERTKDSVTSDAQLVASNGQVRDSLSGDTATLSGTLENYLIARKLSTLVVIDRDGKVLGRGEDGERLGDVLAGDALVKRALGGKTSDSIVAKEGVLAPSVNIYSAVPITSDEKVLGAVEAGIEVDNSFVDGVKKATGLDVSVYGGNVLSATTVVVQDGQSRLIGFSEGNEQVLDQVLGKGETFSGSVELAGREYLASYLPLKDVEGATVGMLFAGDEQVNILRAASRSISTTFIAAAIFIALSIFPAYFVSKYLSKQIK